MPIFDEIISTIKIDGDAFDDILNVSNPQEIKDPEFGNRITEIFTDIARKGADQLSAAIFNQISSINAEYDPVRKTDEENIKHYWSEGFEIFQLLLLFCHFIGNRINESRNQRRNEGDIPPNDLVLEALIRLQANGVRIGKEILVLMEAGYPDGAFARWRTMHEHCVFAFFIKAHGNATAERFLAHYYVDSLISLKKYKQIQSDYRKQYPNLYFDISNILEEEINLENIVASLCERFEDNYRKPYGWAAKDLGLIKPKDRITIAKLEENVQWDHLRPEYTRASGPVHASSTSINYFIGSDKRNATLVLPSMRGLEDPARNTAYSLVNLTTALLGVEPGIEHMLFSQVLLDMMDLVYTSFSYLEAELKRLSEEKGTDA